ncbi:5-formyltetrahydrofolate cyclo-ligase [Actinoplanes rectilineatus]|uniref:5-formyltetrahydrofolate cyclo-ligase n=1 Tax=Actinoplanes rectilineatus TaxID=113571 RepID=UPI000B0FD42B|nr:5-formyltetrahydrofolate cyclo-ligase [Actinoplanes rectilineatus]
MSHLTDDAEKSPQNKITLRARLLTARRALSLTDRAHATAALRNHILSLVRAEAPSTIAAYVPLGAEPGGPDLPTVLARALPPGGRLLLPVLLPDNDLDWAEFTAPRARPDGPEPPEGPGQAEGPGQVAEGPEPALEGLGPVEGLASTRNPGLAAGPRGLLEPTGPRLGPDAIRSADLVLLPALAVGRNGIRMGRGGGSYDRVLARLATPPGPSESSEPLSTALEPHSTAPEPHPTPPEPHPTPHGPHPTPPGPHCDRPLWASQPGQPSWSPRSVRAHRTPLVVALLHDGEDVDEVPAEPHDRPVHGVITPTRGFAERPAP